MAQGLATLPRHSLSQVILVDLAISAFAEQIELHLHACHISRLLQHQAQQSHSRPRDHLQPDLELKAMLLPEIRKLLLEAGARAATAGLPCKAACGQVSEGISSTDLCQLVPAGPCVCLPPSSRQHARTSAC